MARGVVSRERVERGITKVIRTYEDGRAVVTFQIRYGDGAGRMVSDTFTTKAKARAALARARTQVMDGDHIDPGSADTKFLKVAQDWIASHPDWKERTRGNNQWAVTKKLPPLHDRRMKQLTTDTLLDFRTRLLATPKTNGDLPSPNSVKRTMDVLYAICEHARLRRHIAINPCADLPPLRVADPEVIPPTLKEVAALIARLASPTRNDRPSAHDLRWPLLVETAAWTGMRSGELAGLKKSDLDLEACTLRVRRNIIDTKGGLREDTPKTPTSRRTIHIDSQLARRLQKHTFGLKAGDYVFGSTGRDGIRKPLRHNQFQQRVFSPVAVELGLDLDFHYLRHFHASVLIATGWSLLEVSRRLGHADASITAKRYAHLLRLRESNEGERLDLLRDETSGKKLKRPKKSKKPF